MPKRKLGLLLSTPPEHQNLQTVLSLVEEALNQEIVPYLYLIDDGVKNVDLPAFFDLSKRGLKLFACAYGAQRYGIAVDDKAVFCGLVVLSDLIKGCDRFIAFN